MYAPRWYLQLYIIYQRTGSKQILVKHYPKNLIAKYDFAARIAKHASRTLQDNRVSQNTKKRPDHPLHVESTNTQWLNPIARLFQN
jgi:hypothetical protein